MQKGVRARQAQEKAFKALQPAIKTILRGAEPKIQKRVNTLVLSYMPFHDQSVIPCSPGNVHVGDCAGGLSCTDHSGQALFGSVCRYVQLSTTIGLLLVCNDDPKVSFGCCRQNGHMITEHTF